MKDAVTLAWQLWISRRGNFRFTELLITTLFDEMSRVLAAMRLVAEMCFCGFQNSFKTFPVDLTLAGGILFFQKRQAAEW